MRLPLRHPPPGEDAPLLRCAHLEALAHAAIGIPLAPAARFLSSARSRGRHGNALQWHLGLSPYDSEAGRDWEDRIEIKLVTVWSRPGGAVGCDKLKVCDIGVDPWHKLGCVLWVFADRLTRVVLSTRLWSLAGAAREALEASWHADPHFGDPPLFVEARETKGRRAPAYYVSGRWLEQASLLPTPGPGVFPFDAAWWRTQTEEHGRDPVLHLATGEGAQACRRCTGPLRFDASACASQGWSPARHGMPMQGECAVRGHFVVDPARVVAPSVLDAGWVAAWLEERDRGAVWRLFDHVAEPEDHGH